ncbi:unnamed protein product [Durusdinium trenchii]|uniref:B30.2/SPRY domain-containing protein n=1 Tax=Durusdinium trenchii TaxID=1381693 RepID=A0ABP0K930_9DINO
MQQISGAPCSPEAIFRQGEGAPPRKKKDKKEEKENAEEQDGKAENGQAEAAEAEGETAKAEAEGEAEGEAAEADGANGEAEESKSKEEAQGDAEEDKAAAEVDQEGGEKTEEAGEKAEGEEGGQDEKEEEGDGEKKEGEEGEEEEEEFSEEGQWKYGESFGSAWKEGDVIGVLFSSKDGTWKMSFSLNGSFTAPMGEAFSMDIVEDSALAMLVAAGDEGEIEVNLGQRLFQTSPKLEDEAEVVRGLGEAMKMRPAWKVQLPKGVKAWPVFEEPSRTSKGRKPLEDKAEVDQLHSTSDNWVQLMEGWVQTRMLVAGTEYEGLK